MNTKNVVRFGIAASLISMLTIGACTRTTNETPKDSVTPLQSSATPKTQQVTLEQQLQAIKSETDFAVAAYAKIKTDGNFFYSPYSLWAALAMTHAGANGTTKIQMAKTLQLNANDSSVHAGIGALQQKLKASGIEGDGFKLKIVNDIWAKKGTQFFDSFLETLKANYDAHPNLLVSVEAVNDYIQKATGDKIKDLIPKQDITYIDLILTNAIYLKGKWLNAFDKTQTRPADFISGKGAVKVNMMNHEGVFRVAEAKEYVAVEMSYVGDKFAMLAILPKGKMEELEGVLSTAFLKKVQKDLMPTEIALAFPKFKIESASEPLPALTTLGMQTGPFSLMSKDLPFTLGQIYHKAFIEVDEEGTTAAAATAVIMDWESARQQAKVIRFDRPFLSLIWHKETGAVLFMGRVMNPSAE